MFKIKHRSVWIAFQYEKLLKFCFSCGIVRHGGASCSQSGGRLRHDASVETQFGPWLRAVSPSRRQGGDQGQRDEVTEAQATRETTLEEVSSQRGANNRYNFGNHFENGDHSLIRGIEENSF
jgi:hypothetical protein